MQEELPWDWTDTNLQESRQSPWEIENSCVVAHTAAVKKWRGRGSCLVGKYKDIRVGLVISRLARKKPGLEPAGQILSLGVRREAMIGSIHYI